MAERRSMGRVPEREREEVDGFGLAAWRGGRWIG
jgi:hypothetical protein